MVLSVCVCGRTCFYLYTFHMQAWAACRPACLDEQVGGTHMAWVPHRSREQPAAAAAGTREVAQNRAWVAARG